MTLSIQRPDAYSQLSLSFTPSLTTTFAAVSTSTTTVSATTRTTNSSTTLPAAGTLVFIVLSSF